ncbi:hypothetical protein ACHAWU_000337 [Discostella pseudostelligera]|uniref:SET domain-containing protein n=1 Tax=Discostella pseudostelligera TaxID=259834 RepID=A0ABD3M9T1_9STRA
MRVCLQNLIAAVVILASSSSSSSSSSSVAAAADENNDPLISKWPEFVAWYRSHGGIVDDRITIGYEADTHIRGTIATALIPADTLLMHTPHNLLLTSNTGDTCEDIKYVQNEMNKGEESIWYTYFNFDDSSGSRVPSQWNRDYLKEDGNDGGYHKDGRAIQELQGLPPSGNTHSNIDWGTETCFKRSSDHTLTHEEKEQYLKAAQIYHTRASDIGLIPLYDLMNHHNGKINTRLHRDGEGGLYVTALVDIQEGEPIYNTYARNGWESSIDVFNGYGFVEDYPQLWRWDGEELNGGEGEEGDGGEGGGRGHTSNRYVIPVYEHFEPNHALYEILVLSPTLGALSPTKQLVEVLGNERRSMEEWKKRISSHHGIVRSSHAHALHDAALSLLNGLPTTLEEDEKILRMEKKQLERLQGLGREDVNKKDVIQAIEYRMAFKRALRLAVEIAEKEGVFYMDDTEEL